jgi:transcriptional regulator GlxA family with amidase domain
MEVFDAAQKVLEATKSRARGYRIEVVAESAKPFPSSSGLTLTPHRSLRQVRGAIDTLVIVGGDGARAAVDRPAVVAWVRRTAPRCRRVVSVCTGAFVLAAAGLLDGRRATTHWARCDQLAKKYPNVSLDADAIYVRDGKLWTSAGVTAGMDLALALVEEDLGREVSLAVARHLVLFVSRPGGQSQFSAQLSSQLAQRVPLRDLQQWISEHVDGDLSVQALAEQVAMSPRNFARAFVAEVGVTPAVFVERARVEVARRLLETTRLDVEGVATTAGFGTVETLRRTFQRHLSVSPKDYRRRFQNAPAA